MDSQIIQQLAATPLPPTKTKLIFDTRKANARIQELEAEVARLRTAAGQTTPGQAATAEASVAAPASKPALHGADLLRASTRIAGARPTVTNAPAAGGAELIGLARMKAAMKLEGRPTK